MPVWIMSTPGTILASSLPNNVKSMKICSAIVIGLAILSTGCSPKLPLMKDSIQFSQTYFFSVDEVWNGILQLVEKSDGVLISAEKSSGVISFRKGDNPNNHAIYFNVYVTTSLNNKGTIVYVVPRVKDSARTWSGEDNQFFEKLHDNI